MRDIRAGTDTIQPQRQGASDHFLGTTLADLLHSPGDRERGIRLMGEAANHPEVVTAFHNATDRALTARGLNSETVREVFNSLHEHALLSEQPVQQAAQALAERIADHAQQGRLDQVDLYRLNSQIGRHLKTGTLDAKRLTQLSDELDRTADIGQMLNTLRDMSYLRLVQQDALRDMSYLRFDWESPSSFGNNEGMRSTPYQGETFSRIVDDYNSGDPARRASAEREGAAFASDPANQSYLRNLMENTQRANEANERAAREAFAESHGLPEAGAQQGTLQSEVSTGTIITPGSASESAGTAEGASQAGARSAKPNIITLSPDSGSYSWKDGTSEG